MNLYYLLINLFLLFSAVVLIRHSVYRSRYFLQMFQQHGYKTNEFSGWIIQNFNGKIILPEHFLYLIILFSLSFLLSERLTATAVTLILGLFSIFWFGTVRRFTAVEKKPLVFTSRMQRLATLLGVIQFLILYMVMDLSFSGRLLQSGVTLGNRGMGLLILADPYTLLSGLLLVDMSIPFFLMVAAWLVKPLENRIQEGFKKRAREKLAAMPDLKVIAVTGSYGKTSTKFLIHALLKERYSVCVTPGSYNTPMGICKVINNDLHASHQVLILEMGARYEGNIQELCDIARPDIAVITNVGKAHLETFGSADAIRREKSTLAREVKKGGLLVLNGDDEQVASMAKLNPEVSVRLAGIGHGMFRAKDLSYDARGTRFLMIQEAESGSVETRQIEMKWLGRHNVQNFLLAAAVADRFGIRPATMALAAQDLEPVEHRLELKKQGGLTIIDDAFNSNPVGAKNAVEILAAFSGGRRIIITPGMIELGEAQERENRSFGRNLAGSGIDLIVLVGEKQTRPILEGIRESGRSESRVEVVDSLSRANQVLLQYAREGDVVLYENDLPDSFSET